MAYATYRLYYETEVFDQDAFDAAYAEFKQDPGVDLDSAEDTDQLNEDDFYREESVCVAVIVVELTDPGVEPELQVCFMQPGSPQAPEWYGMEEAARAAEQLGHVIVPREDKTFEFRQPEDPSFDLEVGTTIEAEGFNEATLMSMDAGTPERLFGAFYIEYRPNKGGEPFPVAVFIIDALEGRMVGGDFGPQNPYAPPSFSRAERRMVARRLMALIKKFEELQASGPERKEVMSFNPARFMGPQFRTMRLPSVEAADVDAAVQEAVSLLDGHFLARAE